MLPSFGACFCWAGLLHSLCHPCFGACFWWAGSLHSYHMSHRSYLSSLRHALTPTLRVQSGWSSFRSFYNSMASSLEQTARQQGYNVDLGGHAPSGGAHEGALCGCCLCWAHKLVNWEDGLMLFPCMGFHVCHAVFMHGFSRTGSCCFHAWVTHAVFIDGGAPLLLLVCSSTGALLHFRRPLTVSCRQQLLI